MSTVSSCFSAINRKLYSWTAESETAKLLSIADKMQTPIWSVPSDRLAGSQPAAAGMLDASGARVGQARRQKFGG